ncbi:hypothetical protein GUJ93_ZPchr0005g15005 [Zizania palustris]|uniref:Uncharacterized protein n=1 Tax=Zizania palustris TaxID=103762 RepID=A0A8J5VI00_ZIZPA|nr:hypothetical protein GUJ93_ZPchr0005g15005 [Zizania palustris]
MATAREHVRAYVRVVGGDNSVHESQRVRWRLVLATDRRSVRCSSYDSMATACRCIRGWHDVNGEGVGVRCG